MLFPEGFNVITTFELKYYRGMSKTFKTLVKMAREHDCKWLLFDRDGEKLEGYKVYGW
jgi:hypothetical protein